jgi:hypothetical protein
MLDHHKGISLIAFLATIALAALAGAVRAEPIDTLQFGLLRPGMTQQEVTARVGEPDAVTELGRVATVSRDLHGRNVIIREQVREAWEYVGTRLVMAVRLIFVNGRLAEKVKSR